jgi:hypothetical protein
MIHDLGDFGDEARLVRVSFNQVMMEIENV